MTNEETISWIFLSTALATQISPSDLRGISSIADGINHAIPTQHELQHSMSWLIENGFVERSGKEYLLTQKGKNEYEEALATSTTVLEIWKILQQRVKTYL